MGRIKKNISFSEHEKEIFDYLTKCGNASALIKKLVYKHMILTGYLDDAIVSEKEKLKKNFRKSLVVKNKALTFAPAFKTKAASSLKY